MTHPGSHSPLIKGGGWESSGPQAAESKLFTLVCAAVLPLLNPLASSLHSSLLYSLPSHQSISPCLVLSIMKLGYLPYKEWSGFSLFWRLFFSAFLEKDGVDVSCEAKVSLLPLSALEVPEEGGKKKKRQPQSRLVNALFIVLPRTIAGESLSDCSEQQLQVCLLTGV